MRGGLDLAAHEKEPTYAGSVRRFHERRREARLWDRLRYHEQMIESHTRAFEEILARHREGVEACEAALGLRMQADSETTERKKSA